MKTVNITVLLRLIAFYQRWISPLLPPRCRFVPSCSSYAAQAIECHGAGRGSALALKRLCRCHPFHPGGYDPVPHSSKPTALLDARKACETFEQLPPNRHQSIDL